LVEAVQGSLTPDLLSPQWRNRAEHPHAGHCYVATEALWFALGAQRSNYRPTVARDGDITHWWLTGPDGVVDPTAAQFTGGFDYRLGRGCGFQTKGISARSRIVLARALSALNPPKSQISGKRVRVYRNLHTRTWSCQDAQTGLVTDRPEQVALTDAQLVVRPGGRARVLATGRKNVHAFVLGTVADQESGPVPSESVHQLTYNPYRFESFVAHKPGDDRAAEPILRASYVWLDSHSRVLALT
jgi:hypothetical protein